MKILHVYKCYYPESHGGVETFIHSLTSAIDTPDVHQTLLTTHQKKELSLYKIDNLTVHAYPRTIDISSCPISRSLLKDFKHHLNEADIIHYHYPWPFGDLLDVLLNKNKPTIVTYHSDIIKQKILKIPYYPLMKKFLKKTQRIITTSENYIQSSKTLKAFQPKCIAIPIGLDEKNYLHVSNDRVNFWKNKLPPDFVLFVGVLRYYKGLHFLLEAIKNTSINVVIAGKGPEEKSLKEKAKFLGLSNVIFTGFVNDEDKKALYHLCKIVIAPSHLRSEAFCISLLEGLLFGKPLISTEIGTGTSFVNTHDISGLVVPPEDPQALAKAITLLMADNVIYKKLNLSVKSHYQKYFTAKKMAENYLEIYKSLS